MPLTYWEFTKYGKKINYYGLSANQRSVWQSKNINKDYKASNEKLQKVLTDFRNICDFRFECYNIIRDKDGNILNEGAEYYLDYSNIRKKYDKFPKEWREKEYYVIDELSNGLYSIYQKPIFFMQILAGVAASDTSYNQYSFWFEMYTVPYYGDCVKSFSSFAKGTNMMTPHFADAYIILCE